MLDRPDADRLLNLLDQIEEDQINLAAMAAGSSLDEDDLTLIGWNIGRSYFAGAMQLLTLIGDEPLQWSRLRKLIREHALLDGFLKRSQLLAAANSAPAESREARMWTLATDPVDQSAAVYDRLCNAYFHGLPPFAALRRLAAAVERERQKLPVTARLLTLGNAPLSGFLPFETERVVDAASDPSRVGRQEQDAVVRHDLICGLNIRGGGSAAGGHPAETLRRQTHLALPRLAPGGRLLLASFLEPGGRNLLQPIHRLILEIFGGWQLDYVCEEELAATAKEFAGGRRFSLLDQSLEKPLAATSTIGVIAIESA
jgi:hypothetical protein